jgi:peptidoglycan hydrolase-like protein with peptidoglycan-binding domain
MRTESLQTRTPLDGSSVEASQPAPARRRRLPRVLTLLGLAAAAVAIVLVLVDPFAGGSGSPGGVVDNGYPTSLQAVRRGTLTSQTQVSGTLGYAAQPDGSPFEVVGRMSGTYTWLPRTGEVIGCGRVLYRVTNNPVVLLCGSTPVYRSLSEGDSGPDVRELNANLVALGYASRAALDPASDYFSAVTAGALERLQATFGVDQTGSLGEGQAVFLPGPLRITQVLATLGTDAGPGAPLAQATSTRRRVVVDLDVNEQSSVKPGDRVTITLPNNETTAGIVTSVGTVASNSGQSTTIPVDIKLLNPRIAGTLDQATVQVQITTGTAHDALIVPVDALLALAGGGYAVETIDPAGVHHLVPVTTGPLFDDADELVQVTGTLTPGERLVVPAT